MYGMYPSGWFVRTTVTTFQVNKIQSLFIFIQIKFVTQKNEFASSHVYLNLINDFLYVAQHKFH